MVLEGLQGSVLVAEILQACGVLEGAQMVVRCDARLLKAEGTLMETYIAAGGAVHVCVGMGGGMQSWPAAADPDMQDLTEDISEIEAAVLNLNLVYKSGLHSSSM